jgi:hypothetical protein
LVLCGKRDANQAHHFSAFLCPDTPWRKFTDKFGISGMKVEYAVDGAYVVFMGGFEK